jgi:hypothetical protein
MALAAPSPHRTPPMRAPPSPNSEYFQQPKRRKAIRIGIVTSTPTMSIVRWVDHDRRANQKTAPLKLPQSHGMLQAEPDSGMQRNLTRQVQLLARRANCTHFANPA